MQATGNMFYDNELKLNYMISQNIDLNTATVTIFSPKLQKILGRTRVYWAPVKGGEVQNIICDDGPLPGVTVGKLLQNGANDTLVYDPVECSLAHLIQEEMRLLQAWQADVDRNYPDARHLISVARNLLWQSHEALATQATPLDPTKLALAYKLMAAINLLDDMTTEVKQIDPVPCKNTTMPPGFDNAWGKFLEHVRTVYLNDESEQPK